MLGWSFYTTVGMALVDEIPKGFAPEDVSDTFPFWVRPPSEDSNLLGGIFQTVEGRATLARSMEILFGYGMTPPGATSVDELS